MRLALLRSAEGCLYALGVKHYADRSVAHSLAVQLDSGVGSTAAGPWACQRSLRKN